MRIFLDRREKCYCAFCKSPNKVYRVKKVGLTHILISAFASCALMFVIWEELNPAAIALFLIFVFGTETFLNLRWRVSLICRQCGFDPSIYLKSPELAAQRVKSFLEKRKNDPKFLLAPALNLPRKVILSPNSHREQMRRELAKERLPVASNKGKIVSKKV